MLQERGHLTAMTGDVILFHYSILVCANQFITSVP